jgi:5-methyltetrahydrofolate--homocysteine methyltransferase
VRAVTDAPLIAYPNAGLPITRRHDDLPSSRGHGQDYPALLDAGCNIVGACCGSGPAHIRLIAEVARSRRSK